MSLFHKSFRMLMVAVGLALTSLCLAAESPQVAEACRLDLAQRLHLDAAQVQIERVTPVTWMSGAWGLEKPGMVYTKALVPGFRVRLRAPHGRYFYHTSSTGFKYAGSEAMWEVSALYREPIEDEPNLNGDLVQISLLGTNPQVLLSGITDFAPQKNGAVLATRRTSRSGFDLLYLAPGQIREATRLASALDFACPVLSPEGDRYATFFRAGLGAPLQVKRGPLAGDTEVLPDLPQRGLPHQLLWDAETPLTAIVRVGEDLRGWKLIEEGGKQRWEEVMVPEEAPDTFSLLLNRSYSLVIDTLTEEGKPVTRVYEEHWQGAQEMIATIPNLSMKQVELTQDLRFALIVGRRDDANTAVAVDLRTGEVLETVPTTDYHVHLFTRPISWGSPLSGH